MDSSKLQIKRFITCNVPTTVCNFKCSYCYIRHLKNDDMKTERFILPGEELAEKLTIERLGGICYFNLCANGETLLHPDVVDFVVGLTKEGHFVDIITNGTVSKKFDELIERLDTEQQKRFFVKFSFHYLELKRLGLMDRFVENVNKIRKSNISYTVEITPHDELIEYINEIKDFSIKTFGALPHITVARDENTEDIGILTELSREEYKRIWGQFNSELFDFKFSVFNEKRKEFCYAGDWTVKLDLTTGDYRQCYQGCKLGNICKDDELKFRAIGYCPLPHCFNAHAFLALGDIPTINRTTYAEQRNRVTKDGEKWLKDDVEAFFSSKLFDANDEYSNIKKAWSILGNYYDKVLRRIKKHE